MDLKAIETKAVNAVRDIIVESDYLDQFIADNDKEPSFDGFIYLYSKPGKKKSDLAGRIAVQVKGTQKKVAENTAIFKHKVETSDLRNYLNDGGIIYFVVHLSPDGKVKRIFYEDLLPIKIRQLLDISKEQATITLKFKTFPTDATVLRGLFSSFLDHKKKQAILHDLKEIPRIDDLQKTGQLSGITLTTAGSQIFNNPVEALLNEDLYVYASINGLKAHFPVELINDTFERTVSHEVDKCVSVNGRNFYRKYAIQESANKTILIFGKSVTLTFYPSPVISTTGSATISYKPCSFMRDRANDLAFFISAVKTAGIEFNGKFIKLPFDSKPPLENAEKELQFWEKAIQALDNLHISDDVDITSLTDFDYRELATLINVFVDNQPIHNINKDLPFSFIRSIGKMKIALVHMEKDEPDGVSKLCDFFTDKLILGFSLNDESGTHQHFAPPCAILDKAAWSMISNINYMDVVPSFARIYEQNKDNCIFSAANNTLLSILLAYDETQKKSLLSVANQLSEWLLNECTDGTIDKHILVINFLQTVKRCRDLNKDERRQLLEIIEDPATACQLKVGAYILLDNQEAAELHFEKMDSILQESFCEWPIYKFWSRLIKIDVGQNS